MAIYHFVNGRTGSVSIVCFLHKKRRIQFLKCKNDSLNKNFAFITFDSMTFIKSLILLSYFGQNIDKIVFLIVSFLQSTKQKLFLEN